MFVVVSESNRTIYGLGETQQDAIADAQENCFHAHHPVTLAIEGYSVLEVENYRELKAPLDSEDLIALEVVITEVDGRCRLTATR
jgi:hypothetical protein